MDKRLQDYKILTIETKDNKVLEVITYEKESSNVAIKRCIGNGFVYVKPSDDNLEIEAVPMSEVRRFYFGVNLTEKQIRSCVAPVLDSKEYAKLPKMVGYLTENKINGKDTLIVYCPDRISKKVIININSTEEIVNILISKPDVLVIDAIGSENGKILIEEIEKYVANLNKEN